MASPFDSKYTAIREKIAYYANLYGIPVNIGIWQIWFESSFNPNAVSPAGARGIAQFMPATAARFGVNTSSIDSSLNGWGKYMSWLLRQSYINGNISFALAGYNAGEGRIQQYKGIPPFSETKAYVAKILSAAGGSTASTIVQAVNNAPITISNNAALSGNNQFLVYGAIGLLALVYLRR